MLVGSLDIVQVSLSIPQFPWITLGLVFLIGAISGRLMCGWICPIGFLQDLMIAVRGRVTHVSPRTHSQAIKIKYLVLGATLLVSGTLGLALLLGVGSEYKKALGPFATGLMIPLSPDSIIFGTVRELIIATIEKVSETQATLNFELLQKLIWSIPSLLIFQLFVILSFFFASYKIPRFWCRYLCPTGALMALFQSFSMLGMKREPVKCSRCPHAEPSCPMQIKILDMPWEKFNHPECIFCMECADACPNNSLGPKFG
jgi:polyferredoxin